MSGSFIHPTAVIEPGVLLDEDVKVWHFAHVRQGAVLGAKVSIGKDVYVDADVTIGEGSRIQNGVNIYKGVGIGRWCFVGPAVVFTNDLHPRVGRKTWSVVPTVLEDGCSLGAGAIIRCGIRIGAFSMVGAGAIVTKDIPPFCLVMGLPAEITHRVCACGDEILPLSASYEELLRECCLKNMETSVLENAKVQLDQLKKSGRLPKAG
jgi:UDP-2-acetamido-3-amino-2,3-dideoxy-glucuronate N-acetyltransferase